MTRILGTDWGSYLAWNRSIQFDWKLLIEKLDIKFAIFRGDQEQTSASGNYSTMANLAASRAAGVPINASYFWHYPDGDQKYYLQLYKAAIEREKPDFIGVDIEQTQVLVNGVYQIVDPQKMSDTAYQLCEGLAALFPELRVVPYTRQDIITTYAPKIATWIGKFDGAWVAGWPDYGEESYDLTWEQIAAGKMKSAYDGSIIDIDDFEPPVLKGQTETKIWQYSSRIKPPEQGFPYSHQYDWNVFYGSLQDMQKWIGKEVTPMATLLYKTSIPQASRATVFTLRSDQALKVSPAALGANAVIMRMGGYDEWDSSHSHMPVYSDSSFKGRFRQLAAAGVPVIGRFNIHGGRWGIEQFPAGTVQAQACPGNFDEAQKQDSVRQNLALPGLLSSWCDGNFSMDGLFARTLKWLDVKAIELSMTETVGFKNQTVNDFWQTLSFNHMANPLRWLMLRGYIPNVPVVLFTGPWWLWLYQNDFSLMLNNNKDWLWLHLAEWTQINTREFPTLSELWDFRPVDSFKFTSYPDLYFERILAHEYSDQALKVKGQLTDANGGPVTVSLSLWNDTPAGMGTFLGATIVIPPEEPPITDPDLAAVTARVAALETAVARLVAGAKLGAG
jgi:hypothetical protein